MEYPNRVRETRIEQELTAAEVARAAGIHKAHLSHIERGHWIPRDVTQQKLARALGVPRDELFPQKKVA